MSHTQCHVAQGVSEMKPVHQVQCITCNIDTTLMLLSRVLALLIYSFQGYKLHLSNECAYQA